MPPLLMAPIYWVRKVRVSTSRKERRARVRVRNTQGSKAGFLVQSPPAGAPGRRSERWGIGAPLLAALRLSLNVLGAKPPRRVSALSRVAGWRLCRIKRPGPARQRGPNRDDARRGALRRITQGPLAFFGEILLSCSGNSGADLGCARRADQLNPVTSQLGLEAHRFEPFLVSQMPAKHNIL